jgi:hypothetical protein
MKTPNESLKTFIKRYFGVSTATFVALSLLMGSTSALQAAVPARPTKTVGTLLAAESRTFKQMTADQVFAPAPLSAYQLPFRPAMDESEYQATKQAANKAAGIAERSLPSVPSLLPATLKNTNCTGLTENGWVPPDTHGAMGHTHYVQVTNSAIQAYTRAALAGDVGGIACTPAVLSNNLNAFMGYFAQSLFDPRVVYDPQWKRFIVTAEAFPQDANTQFHFVAVSKTSNPAGAWWIYAIDMRGGSEFYDYPQLGFDADGVIITANLFDPGYVGSRVTFLSKSRLYNGLSTPIINWAGGGLNFTTIAPPIVRDLGNETWLAAAGGNSSIIRVSRWNNVGHVSGNFLGFVDVPVAAYTVPPAAVQPADAGGATLDTLDARFVNASTQIGGFLYNVHSPSVGGLAGSLQVQPFQLRSSQAEFPATLMRRSL